MKGGKGRITCKETFEGHFGAIQQPARTGPRHAKPSHLVFGRVITLGEAAVHLSVMQQVIVHQVPAPTLVVAAQQGHVALALHGRAFGGDADDGHGAQRALPPHLPGVPALAEADLGARPVRALRDGVAVQREAVLLDVHVPRAVVGAEGVVEGTDLGETRWVGEMDGAGAAWAGGRRPCPSNPNHCGSRR